MNKKKSIVFLGYHTFPFGFAEVQKIILISKSLILEGNEVTVICRNGYINNIDHPSFKPTGIYEKIKYVYASGSCFRNDHFFKRRLNQIMGKINECLILKKQKRNNSLDFAILSTRSFFSVGYYKILSKIFGFKIILNYVEYYSAFKKQKLEIGKKINDYLFDNYSPKLSDSIFPISEFLINQVKSVAPEKKYLKIPGLTDFGKYDYIEIIANEEYFLFCGDSTYKEVILFVIDSFEILNNNSVFLYLVIGGLQRNIKEIKDYINNQHQKDRIIIFSNLAEKQLYTYYKNAKCLLIPLRPTFQDFARFPHKTGEYLASGNPVISPNYGEVKFYFKDKETMLLAESYEKYKFAEKMQYVIETPTQAMEIGKKGKDVASKIFDYRIVAPQINNFLELQF